MYLKHLLVEAGEKCGCRLVNVDFPVEEKSFELIKVLLEQPGVSLVEHTVGLGEDPMKLSLRVGEQVHHET